MLSFSGSRGRSDASSNLVTSTTWRRRRLSEWLTCNKRVSRTTTDESPAPVALSSYVFDQPCHGNTQTTRDKWAKRVFGRAAARGCCCWRSEHLGRSHAVVGEADDAVSNRFVAPVRETNARIYRCWPPARRIGTNHTRLGWFPVPMSWPMMSISWLIVKCLPRIWWRTSLQRCRPQNNIIIILWCRLIPKGHSRNVFIISAVDFPPMI